MKRFACFALSLLFLLLAGCRTRAVNGDETVWKIAPWITYSLITIGVLFFVAGLFVIRRKEPVWPWILGISLLTVLPAVSWLVAWTTVNEYVKIDDQRMEIKRGMLGEPMEYRFDDVNRLEFQVRKTARSKGSRSNETVVPCLIFNDGRQEDVGAIMLRGPVLDDLIDRLKKRGIAMSGDRRGL